MKILGYVANADTVTEQDAKTLTHINAAFGKLHRDGRIDVSNLNILERMEQIRKWNPAIKIVVSIVPAEGELEAFTVCAASQKLRCKVAESCVEMVTKYSFDGVDFDWEYPCVTTHGVGSSIDDKHNYTLLCQAVREEFQKLPVHPLVTIAAGADLFYVESVELPELVKYLDYICLMTYDLKGDFHALTGHHTALFSTTGDVFRNSCDQALRLFHEAGVPKEKLLMGAAFYSRKWEGIRDFHHGFLQLGKTGAGYGPDYHDLAADCIDKNGFVRYWDEEAKAPWLFDGSTFLSYDDETSIGYKCDYIKKEGYGGIFYWEHGGDNTGTLLAVMGKKMKQQKE
ncbi:MAG: chitinase [Clostridiales bacterium]|nr:chitinase [Clostridiales bacterium]